MTPERLIQLRDEANAAADRAKRRVAEAYDEFTARVAYQRGRAAAFDQEAWFQMRDQRDISTDRANQHMTDLLDLQAEHQRILGAIKHHRETCYTFDGKWLAVDGPDAILYDAALSTPPEDKP